HQGDEQAIDLDPRYGPRPPWHDIQLEVRGPAVGDLAWAFRERWEDPKPARPPHAVEGRARPIGQRASTTHTDALDAPRSQIRRAPRCAGAPNLSGQAAPPPIRAAR